MKPTQKFIMTAAALALTAGLAACGKKEEPKAAATPEAAPAAPAAEEVLVRIGHAGPTSGQIAHLGKDIENGARLAVEEANAANITVAGKKIKFELLGEDDAADPKQGTAVAQKLVDAKVIGVVGHLNSGTTIPASSIYHNAGIAQISPAATNPTYTNQGFPGAFRVVAHDIAQGGAIGNFIVNNLGKKVAILDDKTAYGAGLADETEKAVKAAGGTVVIREALANEKEQDFKGVLTKVKARNPDVIMFGGMDAQFGPMLKQIKALGINAKLISGDGSQTGQLITLAEAAAEGVYATQAGLPRERMPRGAEFTEKFVKRFGVDVQVYSPYSYDATHAIISAMQRADSLDPGKVIEALKTGTHDGVTGPIAFDEKGDIKNGAVNVSQVQGGKWVVVDVVGGPPAPAEAPAAPAASGGAPMPTDQPAKS